MSTIPCRIAARIRRMANRPVQVLSRFAFAVCGTIAILIGNLYRNLTGAPGPVVNAHWDLSSVVLMIVGGSAIVIAVLPIGWVERTCENGPSDRRLLSVPIKTLGGFALLSYLVNVGLCFAPLNWRPNPWFVFSICPACALTLATDLSVETVLLLVAPISAAVYGSLGGVAGFLLLVFRTLSTRSPDP